MGPTIELRLRSVVWLATAALLGVCATLSVTTAWRADAAPGDLDSTFVPTAGCRLVDTRPGADNIGPRAEPLAAADVYTIDVHGANGECTGPLAIPSDAVGVALNVTAVGATTASNLRVYPANLTDVPLLSNLNVTAGAPPTPNKVDVQLSPDGKINVFNFRGSVNVVVDVVGYYTESSLTELASRLSAIEAANGAQRADLDATTAAVDALERARPFVVSDTTSVGANNISSNEASPTEVTTITVDAPTAGTITAMATAVARQGNGPGEFAGCQLTTAGTFDGDSDNAVGLASPLNPVANPTLATMETFDVAAGATVTIRLLCFRFGASTIDIARGSVVALFTPET